MKVPNWMTDEGIDTIKKGYLRDNETLYDAWGRIVDSSFLYLKKEGLDEKTCQLYRNDLFDILEKGYLGLASPVFSELGRSKGGLPISCFSVSVEDSVSGIFNSLSESAKMTQMKGGVGIYLGNVRPSGSPISTGGNSTGVLPFAKLFDTTAKTVAQGSMRRGSFAIYLPIDHPDVKELLNSKDHTKGDQRRWIDSNIGVSITDKWMEEMLNGDISKRELFSEIIVTRLKCGSPYIIYIDNVNNANPPAYKQNNLLVETSNICSEITLYTDKDHSFVCCLSSVNLSKYDEWKNYISPNLGWSVPFLSIVFLDSVLSEFIDKSEKIPELSKARNSAMKGRALGLGTMGLAALYQQRMLPFSSLEASTLNIEVHKYVYEEAKRASQFLASNLGEPEWCRGTGMRNSHLTTCAPTRTNSVICNSISMGIEPIDRNYFVAKQDKGVYIRKNPYLEKLLLEKYKRNDKETWEIIANNDGSVETLDFLSNHEKEVFATAREIDQKELIRQAADRQKYICQSQSLNLFVDNRATEQYLLELHVLAWKLGVKSLYYLRSKSKQQNKTPNYLVVRDNCPYCEKLKNELNLRKISFEEIPLSKAKKLGIWHYSYKTVPQLFFGTEHIGGYDDYMKNYVYGHSGFPLPNVIDGEVPTEFLECASCEG